MTSPRSALFVACLACAPGELIAQTVTGNVLDASTRQPVAAADVRMILGERIIANATSDSLGRFTLRVRNGGNYYLIASRLGYLESKTGIMELKPDDNVTAEMLMTVTALPGAPLKVEAARDPYLEASGFYERQRIGSGFYMTSNEISKRSGGSIVDLLRSARGIKVQRVNSRHEVYITSPSCLPQVVLDGVTVRWGGAIVTSSLRGSAQPLEDLVKVGHIEAIEVYRAFNGVPPQYVGPNAHCGTILIWTRHH